MASLLDELDGLERNASRVAGQDSEAIELMDSFAKTDGDLRLLVDRYGPSESAYIVASLAFVLARRATESKDDKEDAVFRMIRKLVVTEQPVVLQGCLSAIHRKLFTCERIPKGLFDPTVSGFILNAFRYSGDDAWVVHLSGLNVLTTLEERKLLHRVFCDEQIMALKLELERLRDEEGELLQGDLEVVLQMIR